ncbi:uncharacterized protein C2orf42 homolog isoform 2-T3 [Porphyrio hochstetteri]
MEPASVRTKVPSFLSDLGKATLRGIRKCPRCGTYNGTRGLSCKNKTCGIVFRYGTRKQPSVDAVKLITGSDLQVYSVRQRDRGPDYRCFVELGVSETAIQTVDGTIITQLSSGRCYVPSCLKAAAQGVVENQCQHVKLALNCQTEATPLALKSSVLNSMQASPETKQTIWQLATEPTGPLVQRITKNVLVVKCKASQKHSLGYLHASFAQKMSPKSLADHRFSCSCQALKPSKGGPAEEEEVSPRCIHFFACICAFASDESLAQEFAHFLAFDSGGLKGIAVPQLVGSPESTVQAGEVAAARPRKRRKEGTAGTQVTSPLLARDPARSNPRRSSLKKPAVTASPKRQGCTQLLDEAQVTLSFQDWLASVTERIHQTMHYQFEGKPEPLVFHIPQAFFDALQQRISSGSAKKRLPNSTTAFVRKDALPLGTFSKYTWHITNILQVKQIFDTPELHPEPRRQLRAVPLPQGGGGEHCPGLRAAGEAASHPAPGAQDLPQSGEHLPHPEGAHPLHHRVDPQHPAPGAHRRAAHQVPVRAPRRPSARARPRPPPPRRGRAGAGAAPTHRHRLPLSRARK